MLPKDIKVLIVDDNQTILDVTSEGLALDGYVTMTAINGKSALFKVKDQKPDIILLDVKLPDIDGFQICRQVRGDPQSAATPIILMTGDQTVDIETGFSVGADDCIIKPIDMEYLSKSILKLVGKKQKIVLVEDDRATCEMVKDVLSKQQMQVEILHDGSNIVDRVKEFDPSLVLLDITLPAGPNGIEICRTIKKDPATGGIPVVMLTGEDVAGSIEQCFSYGADDYLFKPFTVTDLMVKIQKNLRAAKRGGKEE